MNITRKSCRLFNLKHFSFHLILHSDWQINIGRVANNSDIRYSQLAPSDFAVCHDRSRVVVVVVVEGGGRGGGGEDFPGKPARDYCWISNNGRIPSILRDRVKFSINVYIKFPHRYPSVLRDAFLFRSKIAMAAILYEISSPYDLKIPLF